jgi:hypothetical protein
MRVYVKSGLAMPVPTGNFNRKERLLGEKTPQQEANVVLSVVRCPTFPLSVPIWNTSGASNFRQVLDCGDGV